MRRLIYILGIFTATACGDDVDALDAAVDGSTADSSILDASPQATAERYQTSEMGELREFCTCAVEAGTFANFDACAAAEADTVSTNEEVNCISGVLGAAPASDVAFYNCTAGLHEEFVVCIAALGCERLLAGDGPEVTACLDILEQETPSCGTETMATDMAIDACLSQ